MFTSIVVVNHDYGRFLRQAVDSALALDGDDYDVIVVDDGSTDDSVEIIKSYGARITPVLKTAGGHVSAVNHGFAASTGDIVIFLDADDVLYPNCLAQVTGNWRAGDVKLQYRLDTIDRDRIDQKMVFPYFPVDLSPDAIRVQSFRFGVYPWTVSSGNAFGRKFLAQLLPINDSVIYRSPDGYLSKMAPLFGDVRSIRDVLGAYRVHGANVWAQGNAGFRVEPIIRWLNFDRVLQARFEAAAASRGIMVTPGGNEGNTQHMEHRLLAHRFGGPQSPYPADTTASLVRAGVRAAYVAPNMNLAGRIVWSVWFLVLALAPRTLLRRMLTRTRLQTGRSRLSRFLVLISRGPAKL
jgi:hypothetical protein